MESYKHSIEIDEKKRTLTIYREFDGGGKELYTTVDLPDVNAQKDWEGFESFAKQLGENILMDSPIARKVFAL